jgi:hypothetical protein
MLCLRLTRPFKNPKNERYTKTSLAQTAVKNARLKAERDKINPEAT